MYESVIYLGAAILAAHASHYVDNDAVVVTHEPYNEDKVKRYDKTQNYTLEELDDMFTVIRTSAKAMEVLSKPEYSELEEVREFLTLRSYDVILSNRKELMRRTWRSHPFIVVDGFSFSGKANILKRLQRSTGIRCIYSPPLIYMPVRIGFETLNLELRNAFEVVINSKASIIAINKRKGSAVAVDRYWTGTLANTLTHLYVRYNVFPHVNSAIFKWPTKMAKPDVVYFVDRINPNKFGLPPTNLLEHKTKVAVYRALKDIEVVILSDYVDPQDREEGYKFICKDLVKRFSFTVNQANDDYYIHRKRGLWY